ncbi:hypothetical protein CHS0354_040759 [Potamilus streckersoni]|uniref:Uncharacterized protein n=1 Tax=Potamilus streckersoni TaxID=2493646 RepID=A0AAE0SLD4_9BIVA|nr:hypothetical protein CHS0354_040759 [Potamilus streckersoni]
MNTIAALAFCLLASIVSAQRYGGQRFLTELESCPDYFCESGDCGMFDTVGNYNGGQCRCHCFGFGRGSEENRITNCPKSWCYNGQCGLFETFSNYQSKQCRCVCSGINRYGGRIQN